MDSIEKVQSKDVLCLPSDDNEAGTKLQMMTWPNKCHARVHTHVVLARRHSDFLHIDCATQLFHWFWPKGTNGEGLVVALRCQRELMAGKWIDLVDTVIEMKIEQERHTFQCKREIVLMFKERTKKELKVVGGEIWRWWSFVALSERAGEKALDFFNQASLATYVAISALRRQKALEIDGEETLEEQHAELMLDTTASSLGSPENTITDVHHNLCTLSTLPLSFLHQAITLDNEDQELDDEPHPRLDDQYYLADIQGGSYMAGESEGEDMEESAGLERSDTEDGNDGVEMSTSMVLVGTCATGTCAQQVTNQLQRVNFHQGYPFMFPATYEYS
ncbi:hypothetical protein BT69DRAFT_1292339 [Atractiella rhizophila]|nr:hypothetical protein BT69DRAFT_1292339 [Atractiella rhizophila]